MTGWQEAPGGTGASDDDDSWGVEDDGTKAEHEAGGWCRPSPEYRLFVRRLTAAGGDLRVARAYCSDALSLVRAEIQRCGRRAVVEELTGAGADAEAAHHVVGAALRAGFRRRFRTLTFDEVLALEPPEAVIDGWIARAEVVLLYGEPGGFKTFAALDMAAAVSAGQEWHGRATTQGAVVYAVGEGLAHLGPRLGALREERGPDIVENLHFLDDVPNLLTQSEVEHILEWALPLRPSLVVIDTLAMAMPGGDENSAKDMGVLVANMRRLAIKLDAAVLIVHHTTKTSRRVERGSGALLGAVDVSINAIASRVRGSSMLGLEQVKSRNRNLSPQLLLEAVVTGDSLVLRRAGEDGWATEGPDDHHIHTSGVERIREALVQAGEPMNQTAIAQAAQITPRRFASIRAHLGQHPELGVTISRVGRAYVYSLSPSTFPPPPKGGEEEGK